MKVTVRAYAQTAEGLPPGNWRQGVEVDVEPGATLADLMARLGLGPEAGRVVLVNGLQAPPDRRLAPGDQVALFPAIGGGQAAGSRSRRPLRSCSGPPTGAG